MTTGFLFFHRIAQMLTDGCSLFGDSKFAGIPNASFRGGCLGHPLTWLAALRKTSFPAGGEQSQVLRPRPRAPKLELRNEICGNLCHLWIKYRPLRGTERKGETLRREA